MITGIGGQGVQLGAQVLARAAAFEDRHVMMFGLYGGAMRGGSTDSTVVFADRPIAAPPIVSRTWSAIALHHEFWSPLAAKLRPGAVVVVNSTLFESDIDSAAHRVTEVPATQMADELGNVMVASMVMIGAYAALTGLVDIESLTRAMHDALPDYRRQHAPLNVEALRAGYELVPWGAEPAWRAGEA